MVPDLNGATFARRHLGLKDRLIACAGVETLLVGGPLVTYTAPSRASAVIWAVLFYAVCQGVLLWESGRSGRAPWARIDTVTSAAALLGTTLIMYELLWPPKSNSVLGAGVASVIAGAALAGFIATRWSRPQI